MYLISKYFNCNYINDTRVDYYTKLINEIKVGFRQFKDSTDEKTINQQITIAQDGLNKLSMYSNLKKQSKSWTVNMDNQPMPQRSN